MGDIMTQVTYELIFWNIAKRVNSIRAMLILTKVYVILRFSNEIPIFAEASWWRSRDPSGSQYSIISTCIVAYFYLTYSPSLLGAYTKVRSIASKINLKSLLEMYIETRREAKYWRGKGFIQLQIWKGLKKIAISTDGLPHTIYPK